MISLGGTLIALCVPLSGAANWTVTQHAHACSPATQCAPPAGREALSALPDNSKINA